MTDKIKTFARRWGVWIVLFAGLVVVHRCVYVYGDDFAYAYWGRVPLGDFIQRQIVHYQRANGRVIAHLLVFFFLKSDFTIELWRILNPLLLTGIAYFGHRLATKDNRHEFQSAVLWASAICLLHIDMTRQSVYWLTGSFNYVYPVFMLLLFWFVLRRATMTGKGWKLAAALSLVTAASVEQAGMMCLGLCLIVIIESRIICKQAIRPAMWVTAALALAGVATVVCAPGVLFRAGMEQAPVEGGLLALVRYNAVYQGKIFLFSKHMLPYQLLAQGATIWYLYRSKKAGRGRHVQSVMAAFAGLTGCIWLWTVIAYTLPGKPIPSSLLTLCAAVGMGLCSLYAGWLYYRREKDITALAALVLGFGSQFMLLVSPAFGPRTQFCGVIMLSLFAVRLISSGRRGCVAGYGVALAVLSGQPLLALPGVAALVCFAPGGRAVRGTAAKAIRACGCLTLILTALYSLNTTRAGFLGNAAIHRENVRVIQSAAESGAPQITLYRYPNESYRWAMPYDNPYYDVYFKGFYGIDEGVEIVWEG